jgi:Cu(I)/Ag(I) efflux system membrane fusion protein
MPTYNSEFSRQDTTAAIATADEGGLRAPAHLHGWGKAWWWFHFLILLKLARLRFIGILLIIGVIITQWDTLAAYYNKWTRPTATAAAVGPDVEYFCPMHPTIVRSTPNQKCPICFMPLSMRKKGMAQAEPLAPGTVNRVQLSPYRIVLAGVKTWPVEYEELSKEITTVGFVEFNERGQRTVSARVDGRIDKLFANETGQMVKAGDPLALLYSPDLQVTVRNLLDAKRTGNEGLLSSARARLELLGIDKAQIEDILKAGKADTTMKIRSPISGHVINKYVREGQYVKEGAPLYDVADLSTVWIQAQIYEDDLSYLPPLSERGQQSHSVDGLEVTASTRAYPNEKFHGMLAFVYPHVDQQTRTLTVRFEVENADHKLLPGSTATVTLRARPENLPLANPPNDPEQNEMRQKGRVLAVPEVSVIDTGSQKIVYRQSEPGVYEGVQVTLGPRTTAPDGNLFYPVLHGLKRGDLIVTSGSFLVDAETRLNPAVGSIYFGGSGGSSPKSASVVRPSTPPDSDAKIEQSLAKLSREDRALAEAQRFCVVLEGSRLGSMGPPIKLSVAGEIVFVCCPSCQKKALADPQKTLADLKKLKVGESLRKND